MKFELTSWESTLSFLAGIKEFPVGGHVEIYSEPIDDTHIKYVVKT